MEHNSPTPSASSLTRLLSIMARLRDPRTGCAWDREQDFASIAPYTIEEAYEVADAIARGDLADLRDELGDLLLQVVFHARMAEEQNAFDFAAVADGIADKMERRHPHIFGDAEQSPGWEEIKATEREDKAQDASALAGVALALPALMRAEKLQKRAARAGFDWPDISGVLDKIAEESAEVAAAGTADERQDEVGDLLFAVVNLARHLGVDAETALRHANEKFERRYRTMEATAGTNFANLTLEEKEQLWADAKRLLAGGG